MKIIVRLIVWAKCVVEDLCLGVEGCAVGALEDEEEGDEEEALGVGAIEIDVLGLTVEDEDGDEEIEEEEGDEEEALGVGAIEIDVLGLTVEDEDGDEEIEEEDEEGDEEEGADVTDILGVAPVNVTFLTTPPYESAKHRLPAVSVAIP